MFAIIANVNNYRDRKVVEFEDVIEVRRKFMHSTERRMRFADGSTRAILDRPIYITFEEAQEATHIMIERDKLADSIQSLNTQLDILATKPASVARFKSNKPDICTRAYHEWQNSGVGEILTEID